jgi:hypothetical protein
MFLVFLGARPTEAQDGYAEFGGAYVNCWVDAASERDAVAIAQAEVREAEWEPGPIESVGPVTADDYTDDASGREYFEQALLDGVVLVFHTWPRDAPEEDSLQ